MELLEVIADGVQQWQEWLDAAVEELSLEHLNWVPAGRGLSAGWNAWHVTGTADNIVNFVFQRREPIWIAANYFERLDLPKVDQGTGMDLAQSRSLRIKDKSLLQAYMREVAPVTLECVRSFPVDQLDEIQRIRPLGEMPKWRILRQVLMTHGFLHLGEINALRGQFGLDPGM